MTYYNSDTPLEKYSIKGRDVFVKREDLQGDGYYLPKWGKIHGIRKYIENNVDRNKPLTSLSVDGSWSGWLVSSICEDLGIEYYYSFPNSKKFNRQILTDVQKKYPNTRLNPIKPNMTSIMFNIMKKQAIENDWQVIPYGFNHSDFVDSFSERVKPYNDYDNLFVGSGSGLSVCGLSKGFLNGNNKIYTSVVSSLSTLNKRLMDYEVDTDKIVSIKSKYDFNDQMRGFETPFPSNQFWDKKAWKYLTDIIDDVKGSILFWNLGGLYKY